MRTLGKIFKGFSFKLAIFRMVMKDSRTPFWNKLLVGIALVYLLSPLDMIPDFISLLGSLDDVVVVPTLIFLAFKLIPANLLKKYRQYITEHK
jgi:uncharacterized membrane protein YkvA (DUF1232 family)